MDHDFGGLAPQWFDQAVHSFREEQNYGKAAAAAQIAQAAVFLTDAQAVADQARAEVERTMGQVIRGGSIAIERMAEATGILQQATRSGPRHPAIHAALAVLTGVEETEPRQGG